MRANSTQPDRRVADERQVSSASGSDHVPSKSPSAFGHSTFVMMTTS